MLTKQRTTLSRKAEHLIDNCLLNIKQAPEAEGYRKDKEDKGERRDRADQAAKANSCKTLSH